MSFDSRIRDELRHATEGHDLRQEDSLRHVKTVQLTEWPDLTVVALEQTESPHSKHVRAQRAAGAFAACALLAGAVALPVALNSRSRTSVQHITGPTTGSSTCSRPVEHGYRSAVVMRIAEKPPTSASTPSTNPVNIKLAEPVQFAFSLCNKVLVRSDLHSGDPAIGFDAMTNASGEMLSLTVVAPTRVRAQVLALKWAKVFRSARIAAAKHQVRQEQHQLTLRIVRLDRDLQKVDERLVKMMPVVYKDVLRFDAPNGKGPNRGSGGPPPVPEKGSPAALNLAFERIQLLSSLTEAGDKGASLRITVVKPDVFATIVSQSLPVAVHPPHHDTSTSTVLIAIGLLLGGVLLAGCSFWLGRRSRTSQPSRSQAARPS